MKRALLASYEKDENLIRLGKLLREHDWSLWGSAGTAKYLNEHGLPCEDVASLAGGAPILGHRVVTLARKVHAALLAKPEDDAELERMGVRPFGIVYVTLYPLEKTIADRSATPEDVLERTDIGGPTLLRSGAKGQRLVLSDPSQIDLLAAWLQGGAQEKDRPALVIKLAAAAERRVAEYVDASAAYWEAQAAKLQK